jgi:hypothetical protein
LVERFEEKAALQHPIFKPVDLPEFQIGDDNRVKEVSKSREKAVRNPSFLLVMKGS